MVEKMTQPRAKRPKTPAQLRKREANICRYQERCEALKRETERKKRVGDRIKRLLERANHPLCRDAFHNWAAFKSVGTTPGTAALFFALHPSMRPESTERSQVG